FKSSARRASRTPPAMDESLSYPVGRYQRPGVLTADQRRAAIDSIANTPAAFRAAVRGLNETQLDTPYRPDGWTVRQVVHHVPDSHLNAYTRIKLALTEDEPVIKPYEEARWAELADARTGPIEPSLALLEFLHQRWLLLLHSLRPPDFARRYQHPELGRMFGLDEVLALYAWHGRHHVAHITSLRQRKGWG